MEIAKNNQLPFLNVLVIKDGPNILTKVYRKQAASNRYIHFTSAHPWKDKTAAMRTLASRAYTYCSPQYLEEELDLLTQIFMQNGYPAHIVRKYINKSNPPTSDQATSTNAQPTNHEFFAPFHPTAHRLFRKLKNTFNIQPVFTTTPSLGNFLFKRRPPTNPLTKPGVIYAIPCECNQFYIGETKRTAAIRTAEEKAACNKVDRTNIISTNSKNDLGITYHHKETGHNFLFEKTHILANESNWHKRKLLEGMFIEVNKNQTVNLKSGTKINNCWTPLLKTIPMLTIPKTHAQPYCHNPIENNLRDRGN